VVKPASVARCSISCGDRKYRSKSTPVEHRLFDRHPAERVGETLGVGLGEDVVRRPELCGLRVHDAEP
jgi:hypothetical protein